MHICIERRKFIEAKSTEGFVTLDTSECVLSEGANWNDLALTLDAADDVAESFLLGKAIGRQLCRVI